MTKDTHLDPSLKLRNAAWTDVNAVAKLIYDVCEADGDVTVATPAETLEHAWHEAGFNPLTDAFVVETSDGRIVGYEDLYNEKDYVDWNADGYVHPDFKGLGIGTTLLACVEERACELMKLADPELRVFIISATSGKDELGKNLLADMGYSPVRHFWRMEIKLDSQPTFELPAGVEFRPFEREAHARLVWEAEMEAFSEHWGSHKHPFEEWEFSKLERAEFDPVMWLIAWDGDKIAGFSQNRFRMGIGWVGTLGVLKPWRKKGLGLALLNASFADFYQRGMKTVGLGVDASNSTGATRLYERAGMSVASDFINFEKEIRPGKPLEDADQRK
ncbi:MAG: GNAT family N-acetyltransferase [Anaerolineales bacterium]|nr:GNAT family N-acetyltransferase [Anaerolineales bacterium]